MIVVLGRIALRRTAGPDDGLQRIVGEGAAGLADARRALFLAGLQAHQQIVLDAARAELARQVQRVGQRGVAGLLPGVVGRDLAGRGAVGTGEIVVEVLAGLALAGHPAQVPAVVEVIGQIGAQHAQAIFHVVARRREALADGNAGWQLVIDRTAIGHAPDVVIGVLAGPAPSRAGVHQDAGRDHLVAVAYAFAEAVGLLAVGRQAHGHVLVEHAVDVDGAAHVVPGAAAQRDAALGVEARLLAHHVDHAAARAAAVEHRGRSLEDLDALHIGRAAAHLAAFAHAVAVDVALVGLEAADVHALATHVVGGVHARHAVQHGGQVVDAVALVFVDLQRIDGLRDVLGRQVGLGRRGHAFGAHVVRVVLGGVDLQRGQGVGLLRLRLCLCLGRIG